MELTAKPGFEEAKTAWRHFWSGEVYRRPIVLAECHEGPWPSRNDWRGGYWRAVHGQHEETLAWIDELLEHHHYLAESIPAFVPDYGPDQYAAFLGAEFQFAEATRDATNWVEPLADDWDDLLPLRFDETNHTWQGVLGFARRMAEHGAGRYLVSPIDAHSHADMLSALRGPQRFAEDLLLEPDRVEEAMRQATPLFARFYDAVYEAGAMGGERGSCQGFWSDGKFGIIQCDFIYLIGPEHFRRFILPAIEAETEHLDHSYFHLDGPCSFRHLDDLLALPRLGAISVDSGDGQPPNHTWTDLFHRILAAGKAIHVYGHGLSLERIKVLHRELGPARVAYRPAVGTRREVEEICDWLERNT